jgi:hypothetical protein
LECCVCKVLKFDPAKKVLKFYFCRESDCFVFPSTTRFVSNIYSFLINEWGKSFAPFSHKKSQLKPKPLDYFIICATTHEFQLRKKCFRLSNSFTIHAHYELQHGLQVKKVHRTDELQHGYQWKFDDII